MSRVLRKPPRRPRAPQASSIQSNGYLESVKVWPGTVGTIYSTRSKDTGRPGFPFQAGTLVTLPFRVCLFTDRSLFQFCFVDFW
jgi:hypothetical protein